MLIIKHTLEDDRFIFRAEYDDEVNILYNHYEDKKTKEVFRSENIGELNGKVKFNKNTIDEYVEQAKGAAFPIIVPGIGFVCTYDDLEARKHLIGEKKFNELVQQYPRLIRKINQLGNFVQVIYKVQTSINLDTGEKTTKVLFDNSKDNWWSAADTPEVAVDKVFTLEEQEKYDQCLKSIIYLNPIERYIWKRINGDNILQ